MLINCSRWCSNSIHGSLLPQFPYDHVARFRWKCRRLYSRRTSRDLGVDQAGKSEDLDICRGVLDCCVHHTRLHSSVSSGHCCVSRHRTLPFSMLKPHSFFFIGYGAATTLALNNVYCANIQPSSAVLGAAHGSYGVGGTIAPIIGTAIVSKGVIWSRFYFLLLGLRFCCIVFSAWAFWSYKEDSTATLLTALEATASRQNATAESGSKMRELKLALKNRVTVFGALFIFAYQGAEVAVSGWIISYLINYRDGDPAKVGYVTAGFWVSAGAFDLLEVLLTCLGWYHLGPIRSYTRCSKNRREELCHWPHSRHNGSSTYGLADSKCYW